MMPTIGELYRYDDSNAQTRSLVTNLLAQYPLNGRTGPIAFDASESWLFAPVHPNNELIGLHIATGTQEVLAIVLGASENFGLGIAISPALWGMWTETPMSTGPIFLFGGAA